MTLSCVLLFLSMRQIIRNLYGPGPVEKNAKWASYVTAVAAVSVLSNIYAGQGAYVALPLYLTLTLSALYPLTSSVIPFTWACVMASVSMCLSLLVSAFMVAGKLIYGYEVAQTLCVESSVVIYCILISVLLASVALRLTDIRAVMRSGSVWSIVCLYVDAVYALLLALIAIFLPRVNLYVISIMMLSVAYALCVRIRNSSVFVLMTNHERRIVESMKVSRVEYLAESTGTDQMYNHIYERVLRYFEKNKPYLNNDLTINDIVEVIYTNKLYISKAISHCTGRNFCQFVNYHRIIHAVECFRENPQLKVVDLAGLSGFNSTTSFSAAFRLYMGEKPGDWCRKERVTLSKK